MKAVLEVLGALAVSYILSYFPWRFLYGRKDPPRREVDPWRIRAEHWKDR